MSHAEGARTRVLRVITRLNVGGPAIQAISLSALLEPRGYDTTLVRGGEGAGEGNMDHLAVRHGVAPVRLPTLRREAGLHDLRALGALVRLVRRVRPRLVHTHMAKAGTLTRVAALLGLPPSRRPVLVHTYHGHSLRGYFSGPVDRLHLGIERTLARHTDQLIAVSNEVRDELVALGVARAEGFRVVPLGFDLAPFVRDEDERRERRAAVRDQVGIPHDAPVVTILARLVPIKRVDRFLRIAARVAERSDARFVVVGDGELHDELHGSAEAAALGPALAWTGFRRDVADLCFASDVVVLTSDNEGTPVSLIEAQAAGVPVVSTDVGGTRSVVLDGTTGYVVDVDDEAGFAARIAELIESPDTARRMADAGRRHVTESFGVATLVDRIDALYGELLDGRPRSRAEAGRRPVPV